MVLDKVAQAALISTMYLNKYVWVRGPNKWARCCEIGMRPDNHERDWLYLICQFDNADWTFRIELDEQPEVRDNNV